MFTEKFAEVIKNEGVVSIVSWGVDEPHMVNTWNSYIVVTADERILIPAYAMRRTEKNVNQNNRVKLVFQLITVRSHVPFYGRGVFAFCHINAQMHCQFLRLLPVLHIEHLRNNLQRQLD